MCTVEGPVIQLERMYICLLLISHLKVDISFVLIAVGREIGALYFGPHDTRLGPTNTALHRSLEAPGPAGGTILRLDARVRFQ